MSIDVPFIGTGLQYCDDDDDIFLGKSDFDELEDANGDIEIGMLLGIADPLPGSIPEKKLFP